MDITINSLNDLRLFASYYVEATNSKSKDKEIFINFIKESNENQIINLLSKGKMISDKSVSVNESFMADLIWFTKEFGPVTTGKVLVGSFWPHALVVAAASYAATKLYKRYLSKAGKACAGKKGVAKQTCLQKFKVDAMKQRITALNSGKGQCKKTKDPAKCAAGIDKKIGKLKKKISSYTP